MTPALRRATRRDLPALARLWHDTWHEAHALHVAPDILAERTPDSFAARLAEMLDRTTMAEDPGGPTGFCVIGFGGGGCGYTGGEGELEHLFVASRTRGTGLGSVLLAEAEARLAEAGRIRAHLFCLPQNTRALRFYRRHGWREDGERIVHLRTRTGILPLPSLLLQKALTAR